LPYVLIAAGFLLLFGGGECLVRGAVTLARRIGVSPLLVGATVVAFGTSAPELAVAIKAQFTGHGDIAMGSVVGSNIANTLLVLGATALLRPVAWERRTIFHDAGGLVVASALFCGLAAHAGVLTRAEGIALFGSLLFLTSYNYWRERRQRPLTLELLEREADEFVAETGLPKALLFTGIGFVAIFFGAGWLVDGAAEVARVFGISEATIGLTIVAIGTSLPELAACCVAACRGHADLALGNVIGSNVFNMLGIGGVAATIAPLWVATRILHVDLWIMLAAMVGLAVCLLATERIGRAAGILGIATYLLWIASHGGALH
jgi:cation:H+ antiporter